MITRDWQAAVAGGPSWEGKQIIIPTAMVRATVRVIELLRPGETRVELNSPIIMT